jgi:hypothetical protein
LKTLPNVCPLTSSFVYEGPTSFGRKMFGRETFGRRR